MAPLNNSFLVRLVFAMHQIFLDATAAEDRALALNKAVINQRKRRLAIRRQVESKRAQEKLRRYITRRQKVVTTFLHALLSIAKGSNITRTIRSLPMSRHWWERIVLGTWTNEQWLANFRMGKATFDFIVGEIRQQIQKADTSMRQAIRVEHRLAITLWRLATNIEFRTLGHLFGVGKSTACVIVQETCAAIKDCMMKATVKFPTGDYLRANVQRFEQRFGFPQIVGAIDGSHIPIKAPMDNAKDYYNRKGFHSIILQAVVDFHGKFIDLCVGWAGSVHDARVFSNSAIYTKLENRTLFPATTRRIEGVDVPLFLLGDPAYPLMKNVIKGYSDTGHLTRQQHHFNMRLSGARCTVERSFGRLKGRWRILDKRNDHALHSVPTIVTVCCILHNICEDMNEPFHDFWLAELHDGGLANIPTVFNGNDEDDGVIIRQALLDHINHTM